MTVTSLITLAKAHWRLIACILGAVVAVALFAHLILPVVLCAVGIAVLVGIYIYVRKNVGPINIDSSVFDRIFGGKK